MWAILAFRVYLEGSKFTVRADQDRFTWLLTMTEVAGKPVGRPLKLLQFDSDALHHVGVKHQAAGAL